MVSYFLVFYKVRYTGNIISRVCFHQRICKKFFLQNLSLEQFASIVDALMERYLVNHII